MLKTEAVNNIQEVLKQLGVSNNTLSNDEKSLLDTKGYLVIPGIFKAKQVSELQSYFEELTRLERAKDGLDNQETKGTRHWGDAGPLLAELEELYTNPRVLAAVYHVLQRDFRVGSITGRDPLPGFGQQGLHSDWAAPSPQKFFVVNTIWPLDEFTVENGSTRIVPGSHLSFDKVSKTMAQPGAHHPREVFVTIPAGSVLIFNSHIWHSGTMNNSKHSRRAILCMYAAREQPQFAAQFPVETAAISPAAKYLFKT